MRWGLNKAAAGMRRKSAPRSGRWGAPRSLALPRQRVGAWRTWVVGWLGGWVVGSLVACLVAWLVVWLVGRLVGWVAGCLLVWLLV